MCACWMYMHFRPGHAVGRRRWHCLKVCVCSLFVFVFFFVYLKGTSSSTDLKGKPESFLYYTTKKYQYIYRVSFEQTSKHDFVAQIRLGLCCLYEYITYLHEFNLKIMCVSKLQRMNSQDLPIPSLTQVLLPRFKKKHYEIFG